MPVSVSIWFSAVFVPSLDTSKKLEKNLAGFVTASVFKAVNGNELDLCLLESDGLVSMPKIHIALSGPKIGEVVYNVAAPTGFFHPPTVPLLSGYHSGPLGQYHSLLTVPATGGSSGSPVINSDGELIGLIFAANTQFPHLAIGIRYEHLKKYLQEELYSNPSL